MLDGMENHGVGATTGYSLADGLRKWETFGFLSLRQVIDSRQSGAIKAFGAVDGVDFYCCMP